MRTINQNVEIAFNAIDVKDAVVMAPLMNELKEAINFKIARQMYLNMSAEEQSKYNTVYADIPYFTNNEEAIFEILSKLGFVTTEENKTVEEILESHRR